MNEENVMIGLAEHFQELADFAKKANDLEWLTVDAVNVAMPIALKRNLKLVCDICYKQVYIVSMSLNKLTEAERSYLDESCKEHGLNWEFAGILLCITKKEG